MSSSLRSRRTALGRGDLALVVAGAVVAVPTHAQRITSTFSGLVTATLDAAAFQPSAFTITIRADIAALDLSLGATRPQYTGLTGTYIVAGVGGGTFTNPVSVFDDQAGTHLGFGTGPTFDLIDVVAPPAGSYDPASAIGPVTAFGLCANGQFTDVATSLGALTCSSVVDRTAQAAVGATAVVPEPGTWMLLGTGLVAPGAVRRRRA